MAEPKKALTLKMKISGVRETIAAFNDLPKTANAELRASALKLAEMLATRERSAATASSRQAALMAPTIKAVRDRLPAVQVGGTKRVGSRRKPAWKVLFGAEFGSTQYRQFRPHRGRQGYWFFPTAEAAGAEIDREWNKAADRILLRFKGNQAVTQIINLSTGKEE